jgi:hypothetical protein
MEGEGGRVREEGGKGRGKKGGEQVCVHVMVLYSIRDCGGVVWECVSGTYDDELAFGEHDEEGLQDHVHAHQRRQHGHAPVPEKHTATTRGGGD